MDNRPTKIMGFSSSLPWAGLPWAGSGVFMTYLERTAVIVWTAAACWCRCRCHRPSEATAASGLCARVSGREWEGGEGRGEELGGE